MTVTSVNGGEQRRDSLVKRQTPLLAPRCSAMVHALLGEQGIIPPDTDLFGKGGRVFLQAITLPEGRRLQPEHR